MGIANFFRGDTKKYGLLLLDKETNVPISVDNGVLTFSMKKKQRDVLPVLTVVVNSHEIDPMNPIGLIDIVIPSDLTATLKPMKYFYDFEFTSSLGEVTTIIAGIVEVLYDISVKVIPVIEPEPTPEIVP